MFIGHFAVAFAAKKVAPKASLGALIFVPWGYWIDRHREMGAPVRTAGAR